MILAIVVSFQYLNIKCPVGEGSVDFGSPKNSEKEVIGSKIDLI